MLLLHCRKSWAEVVQSTKSEGRVEHWQGFRGGLVNLLLAVFPAGYRFVVQDREGDAREADSEVTEVSAVDAKVSTVSELAEQRHDEEPDGTDDPGSGDRCRLILWAEVLKDLDQAEAQRGEQINENPRHERENPSPADVGVSSDRWEIGGLLGSVVANCC